MTGTNAGAEQQMHKLSPSMVRSKMQRAAFEERPAGNSGSTLDQFAKVIQRAVFYHEKSANFSRWGRRKTLPANNAAAYLPGPCSLISTALPTIAQGRLDRRSFISIRKEDLPCRVKFFRNLSWAHPGWIEAVRSAPFFTSRPNSSSPPIGTTSMP